MSNRTTTTQHNDELDLRLALLNSMLKTPHRDVAEALALHGDYVKADPLLYERFAAWYFARGEVRDIQEVLVATLAVSDFPSHRDVGLALLRTLPPYQVARVIKWIKGTTVKVRDESAPQPASRPARGRAQSRNRVQMVEKKVGLNRNVPRSMRTEVARYLADLEANPNRFDRAVLTARKSVKYLYETLHIQPGPRAQAILFDNNPPDGSLPFQVKALTKADSDEQRALAIAEHRISYRVATSVLPKDAINSPAVKAALISVMTPQEVINNQATLKEWGVSKKDSPELWALVQEKLRQAETDKRVSAMKTKVAAVAAGVDEETEAALNRIADAQIAARDKITRTPAFLIDKSNSMDVALEVARQAMALSLRILDPGLPAYACAFDRMVYPLQVNAGMTLAEIDQAMAGLSAHGRTACGAPIEWLRRMKYRVEQFIFFTDEDESEAPHFKDAYQAYAEEMGISPAVVIVKVGFHTTVLEDVCRELGVDCVAWEFSGDYYALPNLIPLLTQPSMFDLLMDIMAYPLPTRKEAAHG